MAGEAIGNQALSVWTPWRHSPTSDFAMMNWTAAMSPYVPLGGSSGLLCAYCAGEGVHDGGGAPHVNTGTDAEASHDSLSTKEEGGRARLVALYIIDELSKCRRNRSLVNVGVGWAP